MFYSLTGTIVFTDDQCAAISCNGVAFQCFTSRNTLAQLRDDIQQSDNLLLGRLSLDVGQKLGADFDDDASAGQFQGLAFALVLKGIVHDSLAKRRVVGEMITVEVAVRAPCRCLQADLWRGWLVLTWTVPMISNSPRNS